MTATFLLIRHGAHGDLDLVLSGRRAGVPLRGDGRTQVARLAGHLRGEPITRIQCSPVERTRETANILADAFALPAPEVVEALTEIDFGDWTGAAFAELQGDPAWDRWNNERATARPPGGEAMADARARIVEHLRATARAHGGELIAVVTHADMVKAVVTQVLGTDLQAMHAFNIDPASVTRVVIGDWGGRVLSLNEKARA